MSPLSTWPPPAVRADLHTSGSVLQLIVASYTVTYSTLLITGARAGDRFGHARVFATGILCFTLMSLTCGMAPNSFLLVLARLLQGAAAALMMPQVMSLIQRTFDGILVSALQVGQLLGIAVYGSVYFAMVHSTSARESAEAFAHTLYWAALACVAGALAGLVFIRMIRVKEEARP